MQLDPLEAEILKKLERLSEGGTLDLERPSLHHVHPGSSVPPGVDEETQESHLSPNMSLWLYHREKLNAGRERGFVWRLTAITQAAKDYQTQLARPPTYIDPDSEKNANDRDEAILRWTGKRPEEVAVWEHCSYSYVRKVRRLHKLNQMTGEPVEELCA